MSVIKDIASYFTRSPRAHQEVSLEKWKRYGFDPNLYGKYPDFQKFLYQTPLASQMKLSRDKITEKEGEPAILVEGKWVTLALLENGFILNTPSDIKSVNSGKGTGESIPIWITGQVLFLIIHFNSLHNPD